MRRLHMGDEADALINQEMVDGESLASLSRTGGQCKHCGIRGLIWGDTVHGWRLHDDRGEVHTCQAYYDNRDAVIANTKREE
jgi:hypothetical protein